MVDNSELQNKIEFESVIEVLQGDKAYLSVLMTLDSTMKLKYSTLIMLKWENFLGQVGKALIIFSLAISAYNIITAKDKISAIKREVVVTGSGLMGW